MKIRIYQINPDRDIDHIRFQGTQWLFTHTGYKHIQSYLYDKVFEGEVSCRSLEAVFSEFNADNRPNSQTMRSLSVSDVIAVDESDTVKPGCYYCDTVGFTEVDFQPTSH